MYSMSYGNITISRIEFKLTIGFTISFDTYDVQFNIMPIEFFITGV